MIPKLEEGDIIIRRASNGWLVLSSSDVETDHFITTVYEDPEYQFGEDEEHRSLINLFKDQFDGYIQSKKHGGIKIEWHKAVNAQDVEIQ